MRVLPSPCQTSLGETCQEMVTLKKYGPLHCFPLKQKKKKKRKETEAIWYPGSLLGEYLPWEPADHPSPLCRASGPLGLTVMRHVPHSSVPLLDVSDGRDGHHMAELQQEPGWPGPQNKNEKKKTKPAFKIMDLPGKVCFMIHFVGSIYFSLFAKGVYHAWCISPH